MSVQRLDVIAAAAVRATCHTNQSLDVPTNVQELLDSAVLSKHQRVTVEFDRLVKLLPIPYLRRQISYEIYQHPVYEEMLIAIRIPDTMPSQVYLHLNPEIHDTVLTHVHAKMTVYAPAHYLLSDVVAFLHTHRVFWERPNFFVQHGLSSKTVTINNSTVLRLNVHDAVPSNIFIAPTIQSIDKDISDVLYDIIIDYAMWFQYAHQT